jgi:hypothetical protein
MARIKKLTDDSESTQLGQPATSAGQSGFVQASGQPSEQPKQQTASSSGSFVNLKSYLDANKNSNLGGRIADKVQGLGTKVGGDIKEAEENFNSEAGGQVTPIQGATAAVDNVTKDPSKASQDDVQLVESALGADYRGPRSLADMSGTNNAGVLQNKVQNISEMSRAGGTDAGRFSLLKNMFGRSGYNRGQQRLDNALVQGNKEQLNKLRETTKTASDLNRDFGNTLQRTETKASDIAGEIEGIRKGVLGKLTDRVSEIDNDLGSKLTQARTDLGTSIDDYREQLRTGVMSQELMDALGLKEGQSLYGADLQKYVNFLNPDDLNKTNISSGKDQRDQLRALSNILGKYAAEDTSKILGSYGNEIDAPSIIGPSTTPDLEAYRAEREKRYQDGAPTTLTPSYSPNQTVNFNAISDLTNYKNIFEKENPNVTVKRRPTMTTSLDPKISIR